MTSHVAPEHAYSVTHIGHLSDSPVTVGAESYAAAAREAKNLEEMGFAATLRNLTTGEEERFPANRNGRYYKHTGSK